MLTMSIECTVAVIPKEQARIAAAARLSRAALPNFTPVGGYFLRAILGERLSHDTDSKHRLFGFVQDLHLPIGVLIQLAGDAADQVAADLS